MKDTEELTAEVLQLSLKRYTISTVPIDQDAIEEVFEERAKSGSGWTLLKAKDIGRAGLPLKKDFYWLIKRCI